MISTFEAEATKTNFVSISFFYDEFLVCTFSGYIDSFDVLECPESDDYWFTSHSSLQSGRCTIQLCEVCYFSLVEWLCDNTNYPKK